MKYLKKFATQLEYTNYINGDTALFPNVSLVGSEILYRQYDPAKDVVGNYVYSDLSVGRDHTRNDIIGIIAIPAYATPDKKARVLPVDLPTNTYKWWTSSTSISFSSELHNCLSYLKLDGLLESNNGGNVWVETPSNPRPIVSTLNSQLSRNSGYSDDNTLLEPYLLNGKINPDFVVEGTLTDDWDISNNNHVTLITSNTIFKAAKEFSTIGTSQGDWYVPSIAELILISAKYETINKSYNKLNKSFPTNYWFWSCTFYGLLWGFWLAWYWFFDSNDSYLDRSSLGSTGRLLPLLRLS